ncbi:hypothetical protein A2U01_0072320, partial [Trifolium medium]|nr:hypothetical protein [Trifolium medium]
TPASPPHLSLSAVKLSVTVAAHPRSESLSRRKKSPSPLVATSSLSHAELHSVQHLFVS